MHCQTYRKRGRSRFTSPFLINRSGPVSDNPKRGNPMSLVDTDNLMEDASSAASDDDADVDNTRSEAAEAEQAAAPPSKAPRRVTVTLRTMIVTVVICLLAGAAGVLGWLYMGAQEKLDAQAREASNRQRAEEISADYAVNAADM